MIAAEDTSTEWGRKELQGLRGHLERVRRRGAENKKDLFWTLVVGLLVNSKCLPWLHLPAVGWGQNFTHAAGLEVVLSREGVKYPCPHWKVCHFLWRLRWTPATQGEMFPCTGHWLQPGLPLAWLGNPPAASVGWENGNEPMARSCWLQWPGKEGGGAAVCTCNYFLFCTSPKVLFGDLPRNKALLANLVFEIPWISACFFT